jgi:hypothetical protein
MVIRQRHVDAGAGGDAAQCHAVVAVFGEQGLGGIEDALAARDLPGGGHSVPQRGDSTIVEQEAGAAQGRSANPPGN